MREFDEHAYVFDFRSTLNCTTTEIARPGQEISVLVRPERQLNSPAVRAIGKRNNNGDIFTIEVTTSKGNQSHSWTWDSLIQAIRIHRGTPAEPQP